MHSKDTDPFKHAAFTTYGVLITSVNPMVKSLLQPNIQQQQHVMVQHQQLWQLQMHPSISLMNNNTLKARQPQQILDQQIQWKPKLNKATANCNKDWLEAEQVQM